MGLKYRTIRAAASALLVALAVGTGGMTGMASVLAADPGTVALGGSLVDGSGHALAGVHLEIREELPPDGGLAAFQVTTADDGTFSADVFAWGTASAPATISFRTAPDAQIELIGDACSQTWGVAVADERQLPLAEVAPEPLTVTAQTTLLGEVCGTTATPGPGTGGTGGDRGAGAGAGITPPPTDLRTSPGSDGSEIPPVVTIAVVLGLALAALVLVPRPASRRSR